MTRPSPSHILVPPIVEELKSDALKVITQNPAKSLKLYPKKGAIQIGSDADIVVMDKDLNIEYVFAKGKIMVKEGNVVVKGTFE
ncbi:hypothetical protein DXT63_05320 [Thermoanaerobacteraceae bacterium SP2]|nr:hypothetical protein DXT63_05320 [Thermoanaerobacteraceae bacterium SP2]